MGVHYIARISLQRVDTPEPITSSSRYPTAQEVEAAKKMVKKVVSTIANVVIADESLEKLVTVKIPAHVGLIEDGGAIEDGRVTRGGD